jgi:hypothetical protein
VERFPSAIAVIAAIAVFTCLAGPVAAGDPVALVEDVSGNAAGVEFMDYLAAGQEIRLAPKDRLVIDYLRSCWRETITGGTVTIGAEQSNVASGTVGREKIECDGGKLRLTADLPRPAEAGRGAQCRGRADDLRAEPDRRAARRRHAAGRTARQAERAAHPRCHAGAALARRLLRFRPERPRARGRRRLSRQLQWPHSRLQDRRQGQAGGHRSRRAIADALTARRRS